MTPFEQHDASMGEEKPASQADSGETMNQLWTSRRGGKLLNPLPA